MKTGISTIVEIQLVLKTSMGRDIYKTSTIVEIQLVLKTQPTINGKPLSTIVEIQLVLKTLGLQSKCMYLQ